MCLFPVNICCKSHCKIHIEFLFYGSDPLAVGDPFSVNIAISVNLHAAVTNLRHIDPVYRDGYTTSISATTHLITLHVFEISFFRFMVRFQNYTRCKAPVHYSPFSYL